MATLKLRKSFKYPEDDSDEDESSRALDEEEQEELIHNMRQDNEARNQEYLKLFLAVPLISMMSFLPAVITSSLHQVRFISFLSTSSLLLTAYILIFIPNRKAEALCRDVQGQISRTNIATSGPVELYLPHLDGALSLLIALNAMSWRGRRDVHEGFWILCLLPLVVFIIISAARRIMLEVDFDELEDLKYELKGA